MPPEWEPHKRTWMAWPRHEDTIAAMGGNPTAARAWVDVANAIAKFEPVVMLCAADEAADARAQLSAGVTIFEAPHGDGWMRDSGPTFVVDAEGRLGAVDWTFNGWGGRIFPDGVDDARVAARVAAEAGAERLPSKLVNEGGGIHVDGEGTILLTETVQLNPNRNPSWTRAEIEAEFHARLGTRKAIWLPAGLVADRGPYGTDGHIDTLACFLRPGVVAVHGQPDPAHPDYELSQEYLNILSRETDAQGRALELVVLDAPPERYVDGEPLSCSYVNFSFVNGGVVLCAFDDPKDAETAERFRQIFPDRKVISLDAIPIFMGGGGIHCITQQEPLCRQNAG